MISCKIVSISADLNNPDLSARDNDLHQDARTHAERENYRSKLNS